MKKAKFAYQVFESLCESKGVTAYQVCKETGIAHPTISNWKAGGYEPKVDKIYRLSKYFKVPIKKFVVLEEEE